MIEFFELLSELGQGVLDVLAGVSLLGDLVKEAGDRPRKTEAHKRSDSDGGFGCLRILAYGRKQRLGNRESSVGVAAGLVGVSDRT